MSGCGQRKVKCIGGTQGSLSQSHEEVLGSAMNVPAELDAPECAGIQARGNDMLYAAHVRQRDLALTKAT